MFFSQHERTRVKILRNHKLNPVPWKDLLEIPLKVVSTTLRPLEFIAPLLLISFIISFHCLKSEMPPPSGRLRSFHHFTNLWWAFAFTNPPHLGLLDVLSSHQLLTRPRTCLSPWNQMKELQPFAAITKGLLHTWKVVNGTRISCKTCERQEAHQTKERSAQES